jgi:hypothetical protein
MFAPPRQPKRRKSSASDPTPHVLDPSPPPPPAAATPGEPTPSRSRSPSSPTAPLTSTPAAVGFTATPIPSPATQLQQTRLQRASEVSLQPCYELVPIRFRSSSSPSSSSPKPSPSVSSTQISNYREDGPNSGLRRLRTWSSGELTLLPPSTRAELMVEYRAGGLRSKLNRGQRRTRGRL